MDYDLEKRIEEIYKKKEEISDVNKKEADNRAAFEEELAVMEENYRKKIEAERDNFEQSLTPLKLQNERLSQEFKLLCNDTFSVMLKDLIEELATLSGADVSDIRVEIKPAISFTGERYIDEIVELINTVYYNYITTLNITLIGYQRTKHADGDSLTKIFTYLMRLNSKFTDMQFDGRTLLEHCKAVQVYDGRGCKSSTDLIVCENIGGLKVVMPLSYLAREDDTEWYPNDLMRQAIINCVEKYKNATSVSTCKTRSRNLSDEVKKINIIKGEKGYEQ